MEPSWRLQGISEGRGWGGGGGWGALQRHQLNRGRWRYQLGLPGWLKRHAWRREDRAEPCGTTAPSDRKSTQAITQAGEGVGGGGRRNKKQPGGVGAMLEWQVPETA